MGRFSGILSKFGQKNILVVGDLILDKYIQGSVSRISPEAPVPVVLENGSFQVPGGAANVAHNLRGLGAKVSVLGRVGDDAEGQALIKQLKKKKINTSTIFVDKRIPTITKTRVIAQHQQVVRIDREKAGSPLDRKMLDALCRKLRKNFKSYDAVIISDYGKGLITPELVEHLRNEALAHRKVIAIDPKVEHFGFYRDVTVITPNLKETENAIRNIKITSKAGQKLNIHNDKLRSDRDVVRAGSELLRYLNLDALLITLGERGMRLFQKGKTPVTIKTQAREVYDVSGAGDAVIAAFTLGLAAGATKRQAAEIANFAGGIVVGKMGAVAVTKKELVESING